LEPAEKTKEVKKILSGIGTALVAFSGGVDSLLLAALASEELSELLLVTAVSETFTTEELERAKRTASALEARHIVVSTQELDDERFAANGPERCYYCKLIRYRALDGIRREHGLDHIIDGSNADDARDYRPGARAAAELGVRSPLAEAGMTKSDVRAAARELGLDAWNLPAQACLASRVPYGTPLAPDLLDRIGRAEKAVREISGASELRVRHHGDTARIEAPPGMIEKLAGPGPRARIVDALKALGYHYVALDLEGYRTGSMNETLTAGKGGENDEH